MTDPEVSRRHSRAVILAERRERGRIADILHAEALQHLLALRLEIDGMMETEGVPALIPHLDAAIGQVRDIVFELEPASFAQGRLPELLELMTARHSRQSGFEYRLDVDPAAVGIHDELVYSLASELVQNASKHARASVVRVSLRERGGGLVLTVSDDGRGMEANDLTAAWAARHVGIAACAERVESLDGQFEMFSRPGEGTHVVAELPSARGAPPPPG